MDLKQCNKCKEEKPATPEYFRRNKKSIDALTGWCKACFQKYEHEMRQQPDFKAKSRNYEQRPDIKAKKAAQARERRKQPNVKARQRAAKQKPEVKAKHRDRERERRKLPEAKAWREEYNRKPEVKQARRDYAHSPLGRAAVIRGAARRRMRKECLPMDFTEKDYIQMMAYWGNQCCLCGRVADTDVKIVADHWIPLSDQRPDNPGTTALNMIPLCHGLDGCNNSKWGSDPVVWLNGRYGKEAASQIMERIEAYFAWVKEARQA